MEPEKATVYVSYGGYFISILYVVLGLPLAFRMVSPNSWYGVRTANTLQDPNVWYSTNYTAGLSFIASGFLCIALIYIFNNVIKVNAMTSILVSSFVPIIVPMIALVAIFLL